MSCIPGVDRRTSTIVARDGDRVTEVRLHDPSDGDLGRPSREFTVRAEGIGLLLRTPKQLTARNTCKNCTPERRGREARVAWYQLMTPME